MDLGQGAAIWCKDHQGDQRTGLGWVHKPEMIRRLKVFVPRLRARNLTGGSRPRLGQATRLELRSYQARRAIHCSSPPLLNRYAVRHPQEPGTEARTHTVPWRARVLGTALEGHIPDLDSQTVRGRDMEVRLAGGVWSGGEAGFLHMALR